MHCQSSNIEQLGQPSHASYAWLHAGAPLLVQKRNAPQKVLGALNISIGFFQIELALLT